ADRLLAIEEKPITTWQAGLVIAFEELAEDPLRAMNEGYPIGPKADINALFDVADLAGAHVGFDALPSILHMIPDDRSEAHRLERRALHKGAIDYLRKLRLAAPGERTGGRSRRVSPFTAARDFAERLGLPFPDRERSVKRASKSGRRVSERTSQPSKK